MEMLFAAEHDYRYDAYIQEYVDGLIDEHGNLYFARDELDAVQAGLLLFRLEKKTGHSKYRIAADKLRNLLTKHAESYFGGRLLA